MGNFITAVRPVSLFPGGDWLVYECQFDIHYFSDTLYSQWGIVCPPSVQQSVRSRRAEFLAGRYACQLALEALGLERWSVGIGPHRAPQWPPGVVGSISHDSSSALACVGFKREGVIGVGIDREPLIESDVAPRIASSIAKPDELERLDYRQWPFNKALTLIFSAKESFFKAAYPSVGRYLDFDAVRFAGFQKRGDLGECLALVLPQALASSLPSGSTHCGYFYRVRNCFTTGVLLLSDS
ncbi:4'-phosphopantetheinyl transferase family protein [Marinimicrobium locisalis]|uniref:4'-phosphopantetheinyl transferase family protein n=1 Tax=Marinimicrobium locisalis TaxID=546022 RepID=UPI003221936C